MSIDATGFNDTYLSGGVENKEDIAITATSVQDTISTTNTTDNINSSVLTCDTNFVNEVKTSQVITSGLEKSAVASITCNTSGSNPIAQIGCGVSAPTTSPFPDINANISMGCSDTSTPQILISQSAPFATTYSTIIDKDGINQNNSAGSGLTITSNALNCSITSTATTSITGGTGGNSSVSCSTGAVIVSGDTQVFASGLAGAVATPNFTLRNQNVAPTSYTALKLEKSGVVATAGNAISAVSSWAVDAGGTSREWSRIQTVATNVSTSPANQDGTISIFGSVNGTMAEVFNFNGSQNENNCFKPLDMNNQQIRSNSGDLVLTTTASTGTGLITLSAKADVSISGTSCAVLSVSGANTGALYTNPGIVELEATNTLQFTGVGLQAPTASGSAGTHLVITLNGTQYKIALLNP
jgi:hypothetical protein